MDASTDESSVVGDEAAQAEPLPRAAATQRCRRPRQAPRGPLRIFLVVAAAEGLWSDLSTEIGAQQGSGAFFVGAVLACSWAVVPPSAQNLDDVHVRIRARARTLSRTRVCRGFVEYPIYQALKLLRPICIDETRIPPSLGDMADELAMVAGDEQHFAFGEVVARWQERAPGRLLRISLAHAFAAMVISGGAPILHCVPIGARICRSNLLDPHSPSKSQLERCIQSFGAPCDAAQSPIPVAPHSLQDNMHDPKLVIELLEGSLLLKDIRKMSSATNIFARIISRRTSLPLAQLLSSDAAVVGYETLRKARVRLDSSAMMLWRRLISQTLNTIGDENCNLYLFADGSPQWRGLELFAASYDFDDGSSLVRRLLPLTSLERTQLNTLGKTFTLLWQLFLVCGPGFQMLRRVCARVRSVTTDMGVERGLSNVHDCLGDFYKLVEPRWVDSQPRVGFLFPRALQMPGWKHSIDNLIHRGLCALVWFPSWLLKFKALVGFLRQETVVSAICKSWLRAGWGGAAAVLQKATFPSFAHWRWGTLDMCCVALRGVFRTLSEHFDATPFATLRDRASLQLVVQALRSSAWADQFRFVAWFCQWLGHLLSWVGGCPCHGEEFAHNDRQRRAWVCSMKGRRLPEAYEKAMSQLRWGLEQANNWEFGFFTDNALLTQCQGCVRAVYSAGVAKFRFLDEIPYLCARLRQPGIAKRCVDQWHASPAAAHHRVSHEFLSEASVFRKHIDEIDEHGGSIAPPLDAQIRSLSLIPLDDSVAEGPHARAKKIKDHSKRSTWAWAAASMRLAQNLEDARTILAAVGLDVTDVWRCHKAVLKSELARFPFAPMRISDKKFVERLYRVAHWPTLVELPRADTAGRGGEPPDDPGDPGERGPDESAESDSSTVKGDDAGSIR